MGQTPRIADTPPRNAEQPKRDETPRSAVFSFKVMEAVSDLQPVTLGDLSRHLAAPKSTVLRALRALDAAGYIYQRVDGNPAWSLTLRCLRLAEAAKRGLRLEDSASSVLVDLSVLTQEAVHLNVMEGERIIVVDKRESSRAVRAFAELGSYLPAHASSSGKALLAEFTEERLAKFLRAPLERFTDNTITDPDLLKAELRTIRHNGYAVNDGERRIDVVGIAAPIRDASGHAVASIGVSVPRHRVDDITREQIIGQCRNAALLVSRRLGWSETDRDRQDGRG